jgi:hypothetical protein
MAKRQGGDIGIDMGYKHIARRVALERRFAPDALALSPPLRAAETLLTAHESKIREIGT